MEGQGVEYGDVRWKDRVLSMELQDGSKECSVWKCRMEGQGVEYGIVGWK